MESKFIDLHYCSRKSQNALVHSQRLLLQQNSIRLNSNLIPITLKTISTYIDRMILTYFCYSCQAMTRSSRTNRTLMTRSIMLSRVRSITHISQSKIFPRLNIDLSIHNHEVTLCSYTWYENF